MLMDFFHKNSILILKVYEAICFYICIIWFFLVLNRCLYNVADRKAFKIGGKHYDDDEITVFKKQLAST